MVLMLIACRQELNVHLYDILPGMQTSFGVHGYE